jgi:hypothetical protein
LGPIKKIGFVLKSNCEPLNLSQLNRRRIYAVSNGVPVRPSRTATAIEIADLLPLGRDLGADGRTGVDGWCGPFQEAPLFIVSGPVPPPDSDRILPWLFFPAPHMGPGKVSQH